MRRWPTTILAVLALALAAVGVWVFGAGAAPAPLPGPQAPDPAGPAPTPDRPADPAPTADVGADAPVVTLEVALVQSLFDPAGAPAAVRVVGASGWRFDRPVAGPSTARPGARPVGGRHVVQLVRGEESLWRAVPFVAGGVVDVEVGPPRLLRGRVVDADGEPVAAAEVWAGLTTAGGGRATALSTADGRFEVEAVPTGDGAFVVATAADHAAGWTVLPRFEAQSATVRLARPATLEVAATGTTPAAGALVVVAPTAPTTTTLGFPWFLRGADAARLDVRGAVRVDGLPRGEAVAVRLVGRDGRSAAAVGLRLDGAVGRARVPFEAAPRTAEGRVIDAAGAPVGGAAVVALGPGEAARSVAPLPPAGYGVLRHVATSAADGSFSIGLPAGPVELRATAPGRLGAVAPADADGDGVVLVLPERADETGAALAFHWSELATAAGVAPGSPPTLELRGAAGWTEQVDDRLTFELDAPALADVALSVRRPDGSSWRTSLGRRVVQGVQLSSF